MAKAVKLKNSLFLASTSIVHKRGGSWYYLNNLLDNFYPVGSIYMSSVNIDPAQQFGGTWERINGYYPYFGNGYNTTTYTGKNTQNHTLSIEEMPSHTHGISYWIPKSNTNANIATGSYEGVGGIRSNAWYVGTNWGWGYEGATGIRNNGSSWGHSHNIATIEVYAWRRTA